MICCASSGAIFSTPGSKLAGGFAVVAVKSSNSAMVGSITVWWFLRNEIACCASGASRLRSAIAFMRSGRLMSFGKGACMISIMYWMWLIWSCPASIAWKAFNPLGTWPVTVIPRRCASSATALTSSSLTEL